MKPKMKNASIYLTALSLFFGGCAWLLTSLLNFNNRDNYQQISINQLSAEYASLNSKVTALNASVDNLKTQSAVTNQQFVDIISRLNRMESKLDNIK